MFIKVQVVKAGVEIFSAELPAEQVNAPDGTTPGLVAIAQEILRQCNELK
jgi:hypothetical protein